MRPLGHARADLVVRDPLRLAHQARPADGDGDWEGQTEQSGDVLEIAMTQRAVEPQEHIEILGRGQLRG